MRGFALGSEAVPNRTEKYFSIEGISEGISKRLLRIPLSFNAHGCLGGQPL